MAFSSMGGSGNGLRGRRRGASMGTLSEMNVVPLVDVVLVLLIIFMLTAHVMDYGMEVDVPQVKATTESNETLPLVTIKSNQLFLNGKKININNLAAQLNTQFKGQQDVYVAADRKTEWDLLAQVVAALGEAKMKPKLVTKPVGSR